MTLEIVQCVFLYILCLCESSGTNRSGVPYPQPTTAIKDTPLEVSDGDITVKFFSVRTESHITTIAVREGVRLVGWFSEGKRNGTAVFDVKKGIHLQAGTKRIVKNKPVFVGKNEPTVDVNLVKGKHDTTKTTQHSGVHASQKGSVAAIEAKLQVREYV